MTNYPVLSQRDPRWALKHVGYSAADIGSVGCIFIDFLMLVCRDRAFDPAWVDAHMACLKDHGNYLPTGGAYLQSWDISQCEPPEWGTVRVSYISRVYDGVDYPAALMSQLIAHLKSGNPAILEVDPTPGTPGISDGNTHYVLATGLDAAGNILINDPWYGDSTTLCPRYGRYPAYAIYRSVEYDISGAIPDQGPGPDPVVSLPRIGVNVIFDGDAARAAIAAGCKYLSITFNPDLAWSLKLQHPEIEISARGNFYKGHLPSNAEINDKLGPAIKPGMRVLGLNENDQVGDQPADIRTRAAWDRDMFKRCSDAGATYVGGGFAMGGPDITRADIRAAMRDNYAPLFNAGMWFNQHTYSGNDHSGIPIKERIFRGATWPVTIDNVTVQFRQTWWLEERERWYTAFCGFDGSRSVFLSDETGVDGPGPFSDFGYTDQDVAAWCVRYRQIKSEPTIVNGKPTAFRFMGGALFQSGNRDQWRQFEVGRYYPEISKAGAW